MAIVGNWIATHPICVPIPLVLLELENLTIEFPSARGPVAAVREISLSLAPGETLALVGESGSGKSVTALSIMGLLPPQARLSGGVLFEGRNLASARPAELQSLRGRRMAMIFQEPMTALNPVMRIGDQIAEAVRGAIRHAPADGSEAISDVRPQLTRAQARERAIEALREVAIPSPERRWRDYPASALRRPAPARHDRHGHRQPPRPAHRRRAHHGARCHRQAQILALLADLRRRLAGHALRLA